ncbi:GNAT family N-acetyltransferase [Prosthecomicrobium sp. N25]|uniref:GNAT family N-acetyltransferase n=1 Tax=Prosthecomicrobium sp. N25 TaxID=3129254 RepID=UPI003076F2F6
MRLVAGTLNTDRILVARRGGEIAGLAGFVADGRGPFSISQEAWTREHGRIGGALRAAALAVARLASNPRRGDLYVEMLRARERKRGEGVGALLLQGLDAEARRLGKGRIRMFVDVRNAAGRRFYERHGYRLVRTLSLPVVGRLFHHGRVDLLVKTLDGPP